jgi:hypothetical protein
MRKVVSAHFPFSWKADLAIIGAPDTKHVSDGHRSNFVILQAEKDRGLPSQIRALVQHFREDQKVRKRHVDLTRIATMSLQQRRKDCLYLSISIIRMVFGHWLVSLGSRNLGSASWLALSFRTLFFRRLSTRLRI